MLLRCCALVVAFISLVFPLRAATSEDGLKGVTAADVLVEVLTPEAERAGLTREQLMQDVQLKLRQNGIKVDPSAHTALYLNVNCAYLEGLRHFVFSVGLGFQQSVRLLRQPDTVVVGAVTWSESTVGIIPEKNLGPKIRQVTADLVDSFLNAYLAENPR